MAAKKGNQNARIPGEHDSVLIRIVKPDIDLVYNALVSNGKINPSRSQIQDAVLYAIRQVYGQGSRDNFEEHRLP